MALQTQRFGFNKFGGPAGGSASDDGYKFSNADRDLLDKILSYLEVHDHSGGAQLGNPTQAPTAALAGAGSLVPGRTYFYRVSFVDAYGLESAGSAEVSISTPPPLSLPTAPAITTQAAGSLTSGMYYWAATAELSGVETPLGASSLLNLPPDRKSVTLNFGALPIGAERLYIWRQGPADSGFTKIGSTTGPLFVDDGSVPSDPCACDPASLPPTQNLTGATTAVTLTVPDVSLVVAADTPVKRWRVYRTSTSGSYPANSLVADISERDLDGMLISTFVDNGTSVLMPGRPLSKSQTLKPSAPIGGSSGAMLVAAGAEVWRIVADPDGAVVSRLSDSGNTTRKHYFTGPDGVSTFALTVEPTTGVIETMLTTTIPGDGLVYSSTSGPVIPTTDPTIQYRLGVANDGSLVTTLI